MSDNQKNQKRQYQVAAAVALAIGALYLIFRPHPVVKKQVAAKPVTVNLASAVSREDETHLWLKRTRQMLADNRAVIKQLSGSVQSLQQQLKSQQSASERQAKSMARQIAEAKSEASRPRDRSTGDSERHLPRVHSTILRAPKSLHITQAPQPPKPQENLKSPKHYVPSGTFVKAILLGAADASASVTSQANPHRILLRLLDNGTLPNHYHSSLKDCVATASVVGDISSERGYIALDRLSCIRHGSALDIAVHGQVFGPSGKNGVRGVPVYREGKIVQRAFVAGTLSGLGKGLGGMQTNQSLSALGAVNSISPSHVLGYGAAEGMGSAMDELAKYNIKRAEQYHPVIQLSAGTVVDVVFDQGVSLDVPKPTSKPCNQRQASGGQADDGIVTQAPFRTASVDKFQQALGVTTRLQQAKRAVTQAFNEEKS